MYENFFLKISKSKSIWKNAKEWVNVQKTQRIGLQYGKV